jgi:hypothetical protein
VMDTMPRPRAPYLSREVVTAMPYGTCGAAVSARVYARSTARQSLRRSTKQRLLARRNVIRAGRFTGRSRG